MNDPFEATMPVKSHRRPTEAEAWATAQELLGNCSGYPAMSGIWVFPIRSCIPVPNKDNTGELCVVPAYIAGPNRIPSHCVTEGEVREILEMIWVMQAPYVVVLWTQPEGFVGIMLNGLTKECRKLRAGADDQVVEQMLTVFTHWPVGTDESDAIPPVTDEEAVAKAEWLLPQIAATRTRIKMGHPEVLLGIAKREKVQMLGKGIVELQDLENQKQPGAVVALPPAQRAAYHQGVGADYLLEVGGGLSRRVKTETDLAQFVSAMQSGIDLGSLHGSYPLAEAILVKLIRCSDGALKGVWHAEVNQETHEVGPWERSSSAEQVTPRAFHRPSDTGASGEGSVN